MGTGWGLAGGLPLAVPGLGGGSQGGQQQSGAAPAASPPRAAPSPLRSAAPSRAEPLPAQVGGLSPNAPPPPQSPFFPLFPPWAGGPGGAKPRRDCVNSDSRQEPAPLRFAAGELRGAPAPKWGGSGGPLHPGGVGCNEKQGWGASK